MTVDLDALAHDLRLAGWDSFIADEAVFAIAHKGHIHQIQLLIDPWFGDGGSVFCESDGENATPVEVIALIARHLGAGQPVESDRAALVERMCTAFDEQIEYGYTAIALDFATIALEVIEAAGWGPRAEPVAPPEPLSAEEIEAMARKVGDQEMRQWFRQGGGQNDQTDIVRFVLAALPERFPVPVERA